MPRAITGPPGLSGYLLHFAAPLIFLASLIPLLVTQIRPTTRQNVLAYSVITLVVFGGMALARRTPLQALGLDFRVLNRRAWLWVVGVILVNNVGIALLQYVQGTHVLFRVPTLKTSLVLIFSPWIICKFGEELVFRGVLLWDDIAQNPRAFWIANTLQAILFMGIHAMVNTSLTLRCIIGGYAFVFAFGLAILNRRSGSLLPSALVHATSGTLLHLFWATK